MSRNSQQESLEVLLGELRQKNRARRRRSAMLGKVSVLGGAGYLAFASLSEEPVRRPADVVEGAEASVPTKVVISEERTSLDDWAQANEIAVAKLADGRIIILPQL